MIDESVLEINIISRETIEHMTPAQRVRFILDEVQQGKVIILERGLSAPEELELVKHALSEIQHDDAFGVETPRLTLERSQKPGFFARVMGRVPPPRMMVIGPAYLFKSIRKDGKMINAQILTRHSIRPATAEEIQAIKPPRSVTEAARAREEGAAAEGAEPGGVEAGGVEAGRVEAQGIEAQGVEAGVTAVTPTASGEELEGELVEVAGAGMPPAGADEAAEEAGTGAFTETGEVAEGEVADTDAETVPVAAPAAEDIPTGTGDEPTVPGPASPDDAGAGAPADAAGTEAAPAKTGQDEFELDLKVLEAEAELIEARAAGPPSASLPVREPAGHDAGVRAGDGAGSGDTTPAGGGEPGGGGEGEGSRRFSLKKISGGEGD